MLNMLTLSGPHKKSGIIEIEKVQKKNHQISNKSVIAYGSIKRLHLPTFIDG